MISLAHRTLFIHIPKCGGQSVEDAFCESFGLNWDRHRRLFLLMRKPRDWHGENPRTAHLTALEYIEGDYLPEPVFNSFFKFAVVRDPLRKIESHYFFGKFDRKMPFKRFCLKYVPKMIRTKVPFFAPQSSFVTNRQNELIPDRIYKLENLREDWADIQKRTGLTAPLRHKNKSDNRAHTALDWTPEMFDKIHTIYRDDFELFDYPAPDQR